MILYKYMGLDAALAVLRTQTLGFSRAGFFNDPFDQPQAAAVRTDNEIEAVFANVGAWAKSQIWEENTAFLSLTRTPTNALMWAHYADQHRGVVIALDCAAAGFLDEKRSMIPAHFGSVIYARHRPDGPYHSTFTEPVTVGATHHFVVSHYEKWQRMFLTKPIEWAYEEEVRVAKSIRGLKEGRCTNESGEFTVVDLGGRPLQCAHLPAGSIVSIHAGVRCRASDLDALRLAAGTVPVHETRIDQKTYRIDVAPADRAGP